MTTVILSPHLVELRGEVTFDDPLTAGGRGLDVTVLPDGRILVLRDEAGVNPDGNGIGGFLLDDSGALIVGSGFEVSQFSGGEQSHPDVALLADGGFVVTWTSQNQDGFEGGIFGRLFNADFTPRGDEFQISDNTAVSQGTAHVRALPEGGFVVGWNGDEARVQYFTADGTAEGEIFALTGTARTSHLEDIWVDAQGHVIVLTRTTGGDSSNAPVALRNGLSQWVLTGPGGAQPLREWLDPNPDPSGNFNDMSVELFDLGNDLVLSRYYSAPGRFSPSYLMISLLESSAPGFLHDVLPAEQNLSLDIYMGSTYAAAIDAGFVRLGNGNLLALYGNSQSFPPDNWQIAVSEYRINQRATGEVLFQGEAVVGQTVTADLSDLADADGLGAFALQWRLNGADITGAISASLTLTEPMIGQNLSLMIRWTDAAGTPESVLAAMTAPVLAAPRVLTGTEDADTLLGAAGHDLLSGLGGDDTLVALAGNDTVYGGDGSDRINLGEGNDLAYGGDTDADLRDVVFAGAGNDSVYGGYGNDLIYGDLGDDFLSGDFGADELQGQGGNDLLSGGQGSDLLYGGDGNDFLNGGYGYDRLNGGAGTDSFLHMGLAGHGSDWIQDYTAIQGDRLVFGDDLARADQFQVNFAHTPGAGVTGVAEAFVIYRPTGQILWALVDGAAQHQIWLAIDGELNRLL